MGISHVPPVLGGAEGALGGRTRPREEAESRRRKGRRARLLEGGALPPATLDTHGIVPLDRCAEATPGSRPTSRCQALSAGSGRREFATIRPPLPSSRGNPAPPRSRRP